MPNPVAVPGTNVPSGAAVSPGGAQGVAGPNVVSADAGNLATLGSDNLILVPQSQIWSVRLRSFNAIGNPNFEVDQRNCFTGIANVPNGMVQDRWGISTGGTLRASYQANQGQSIVLPGTSYLISQAQVNITCTTAEASLGAGDFFTLVQNIEGPLWRELAGDVTSLSLLVYTNVAGLKFGVSLRNGAQTVSLVKLCTIPNAGQWTIISLQNLPKPTSGSFPLTPGTNAYAIGICLACGTTYTAPANDTWQTGNFFGAVGQSNLFSTINNTFIIGFVQHEPGALCTQLMDLDFVTNLDRCVRYYTKSYGYGIKPGTATNNGAPYGIAAASNWPVWHVPFKRVMAKIPTISAYSPATGAGGNVRDLSANTDRGATSAFNAEDSGFEGFQTNTTNAASVQYNFHYVADVGW